MANSRRTFLLVCISLPLMGTLPCFASAQEAHAGKPDPEPVNAETIAVLPWSLTKGTDSAKQTAKEFLSILLTKIKVDQVSEAKTLVAWEDVNKSGFEAERPALPTSARMLRVGSRLDVDWVMSGSATWHSRSIWVGFGPKTKSTCTIDVRIVDVKKQVVALDVKDLKMDSTAKEDTLKALGTVFITGLFTIVSGGPKAPHEQRAVQLGIAKALEPWLAERLKAKKIDPNKK